MKKRSGPKKSDSVVPRAGRGQPSRRPLGTSEARLVNSGRSAKPAEVRSAPTDYAAVLADMKQLIADSRRRALQSVNRELVCLYLEIGRAIVQQQETANWGDAVVEQLSDDLRAAFPDLQGLLRNNLFRMRQFFLACREVDHWHCATPETAEQGREGASPMVGTGSGKKVATARRQLQVPDDATKVATVWRQFQSARLQSLIPSLSWSHHREIVGACDEPAKRYFYMSMSVRERWSVRELHRQIESALFERYVSVKRDPEKCLPAEAERGDLLPFKDLYILEFLGLEDDHTERQLRRSILANLRDFFLEFGKDLTFVGGVPDNRRR